MQGGTRDYDEHRVFEIKIQGGHKFLACKKSLAPSINIIEEVKSMAGNTK